MEGQEDQPHLTEPISIIMVQSYTKIIRTAPGETAGREALTLAKNAYEPHTQPIATDAWVLGEWDKVSI